MLSKRRNTAVVEARCDIRDLASILQFYIQNGHCPASKNELVRNIIKDFQAVLELRGVASPLTHERAIEIFSETGLGQPFHKDQGRQETLRLLEEERAVELDPDMLSRALEEHGNG